MGKLDNGIWGSFTGKVGNVVGSKNSSGAYIKAKANYSSAEPSDKQKESTKRFSAVHTFAMTYMNYPSFKAIRGSAGNTNQFAAIIATNYEAFNADGFIEDYSKLIVSNGKLALPSHIKLERMTDKEKCFRISWRNNALFLDKDDATLVHEYLNFYVFDNDSDYFDNTKLESKIAKRGDETYILDFNNYDKDDYPLGKRVEIYLFFCDKNEEHFSDSYHLSLSI